MHDQAVQTSRMWQGACIWPRLRGESCVGKENR